MFVLPRKRRCVNQAAAGAAAAMFSGLDIIQSGSESRPPSPSVSQLPLTADQDNDPAFVNADHSNPMQLLPVRRQLVFAPPKSHACRVCGFILTSASNRLRHERSKHKAHFHLLPLMLAHLQPSPSVAEEATQQESDRDQLQDSHMIDSDSHTKSDHSSSDVVAAAASAAMADVEGYRPPLEEAELQSACFPFLQWLSLPPLTPCEALVKGRRVKSHTQLQPIKCNLRFIFALLHEKQAIASVDVEELTKLPICQSLFDALNERQVGSGRFHAIFLLIKKVLVYLASKQSTTQRQFLQPTIYESYLYVEGVCSDSTHRRKQEALNRSMHGNQAAGMNHRPLKAPQPFKVPTTWSPPSAAALAASAQMPPASSATSITTPQQPLDPAKADLTKPELKQLATGCLAYLQAAVNRPAAASASIKDDHLYMAHLVTATLCLCLAPRSQVLKQLQLGSSFVKEADGRYWVKMLAEQSKNGKPTTFAISDQLTKAFDFYLDAVRPRLLMQHSQQHEHVFVKRNGTAPRADFSACTGVVTQQLIGRAVNPHSFRAGVITAFYSAGASQSEMNTLASIMAHDPTTARQFYFRPQFNQAALQANEKMSDLLLRQEKPEAAETAAAASSQV